jgi:hypothetical protein
MGWAILKIKEGSAYLSLERSLYGTIVENEVFKLQKTCKNSEEVQYHCKIVKIVNFMSGLNKCN